MHSDSIKQVPCTKHTERHRRTTISQPHMQPHQTHPCSVQSIQGVPLLPLQSLNVGLRRPDLQPTLPQHPVCLCCGVAHLYVRVDSVAGSRVHVSLFSSVLSDATNFSCNRRSNLNDHDGQHETTDDRTPHADTPTNLRDIPPRSFQRRLRGLQLGCRAAQRLGGI